MVLSNTGLTDKVLDYRAPHPLIEEFTPGQYLSQDMTWVAITLHLLTILSFADIDKDRALFADPSKKSLLSAATKVKHLTPYIGTELVGV